MGKRRKRRRQEDDEQPKMNRRLFDRALERVRIHPRIKVKPRFV